MRTGTNVWWVVMVMTLLGIVMWLLLQETWTFEKMDIPKRMRKTEVGKDWGNRSSREYCEFVRKLTKKQPPCRRRKKVRPLLVTGLGGAGTWQLYQKLRTAGLFLEHEGVGIDGSVSWLFAVHAPTYPCSRCAQVKNVRFDRILHLVRCPPDNVAALSTHRRETLLFAGRAVGVPDAPAEEDEKKDIPNFRERSERRLKDARWLRFLSELWLRWNERIDKYADARFAIEASADVCTLISCVSIASPTEALVQTARDVARDHSNWIFQNGDYNPKRCLKGKCFLANSSSQWHHRPHGILAWPDLQAALKGSTLARHIQITAAKYGYHLLDALPPPGPPVGGHHRGGGTSSACRLVRPSSSSTRL